MRMPDLGAGIETIDTPALIVDLDRLEANITALKRLTETAAPAVRPHAKSHKTIEVARRQIAAGAVGICCAKLGEAEAMVVGGIGDIHITTPVAGRRKTERLAHLARRASVSTVVDHPDHVVALSEAARGADVKITVLVEVDVGHNRCGVGNPAGASRLVAQIVRSPSLTFGGLQGYQGGIQGRHAFQERLAGAGAALTRLLACNALVSRDVATPPRLTGGGTGTVAIDLAHGGLTELQPGSYVFMDSSYAGIAWDETGGPPPFVPSLSLLATVISRPTADRAVIDAGSKAISGDSGPPAVTEAAPDSKLYPRYLFGGDEHGILTGAVDQLCIGDQVQLTPSHSDTTVNLHDRIYAVRRGKVEGIWHVVGRGRSD